jgi:activator of HSP90 ATPase
MAREQRRQTKGGSVTDKTNSTTPVITKVYSRRRMIAGSAIGLASVAIAGARGGTEQASRETPTTNAITMAKAIHQEEDFKAKPQQMYEALLDAKQFSAFSGGRSAEIRGEVGGAFSLFAGHIVGLNVELVPNQRIVQAWRVVNWPEGVYSIARFELEGQGSGTRVLFDHTGFPPNLAEHLASGWQENYWKPLRRYVGLSG